MLILVVGIGFLVLGYWAGSSWSGRSRGSDSVGTSGSVVDTEKARERGAEIGDKSAIAAQKLKEGFGEAALTGDDQGQDGPGRLDQSARESM